MGQVVFTKEYASEPAWSDGPRCKQIVGGIACGRPLDHPPPCEEKRHPQPRQRSVDDAEPACRWCGGELAPGLSQQRAKRCLACGKGTILPMPEPMGASDPCGAQLECGGDCVLEKDHEPPCVCCSGPDCPG